LIAGENCGHPRCCDGTSAAVLLNALGRAAFLLAPRLLPAVVQVLAYRLRTVQTTSSLASPRLSLVWVSQQLQISSITLRLTPSLSSHLGPTTPPSQKLLLRRAPRRCGSLQATTCTSTQQELLAGCQMVRKVTWCWKPKRTEHDPVLYLAGNYTGGWVIMDGSDPTRIKQRSESHLFVPTMVRPPSPPHSNTVQKFHNTRSRV
jgi:hypothetical protein